MSSRPRLIFLHNSAQRRLQQFIAAEQDHASRAGWAVPTPAQSGVLFLLAREDGGLDATSSFIFITVGTKDLRSGYYVDHLAWRGDRLIFARREINIMAQTD